MAIWQFDFLLVPRSAGERSVAGASVVDALDEMWQNYDGSDRLLVSLEDALEAGPSWHSDLRCWGPADGHTVRVWLEGGSIAEVSVRVDMRQEPWVFLDSLLPVFRAHRLLVLLEDERLIEPERSTIEAELRTSDAVRFLSDPREFLRTLPDLESG